MDKQKKLQKLAKLQEIIDNGNPAIARFLFALEDNLETAVADINGVITQLQQQTVNADTELRNEFDTFKPTNDRLIEIIKPLIPEVKDGLTPTKEELLALISPLIPKVKDGKTPSKEDLLAIIKPLIPEIDTDEIVAEAVSILEAKIKLPSADELVARVEKDLPKLGEPIRDSLELLTGDNRLDISAVKGLEDYDEISELARQERTIVKKYYGGGGGSGGASAFTDLTDTFDSYTGLAGKGLRVNATEDGIDTYTPTDTDEKVKLSASDPTAGYLDAKLQEGVQAVQFDTTATPLSMLPGLLQWNETDGTVDIGMKNGVTLQSGQELYFYGKASGAIANGELCQFAGVQGDHILMKKVVPAEVIANPHYVIGVATQNIANGDFGYVTWFGKVNGIYTKTPANNDSANWVAGDILYFDNTTGQLTKTEPTAPDRRIIVASVIKEQTGAAENGVLLIRPTFGSRIVDAEDVDGTPLTTDGQILVWNQTNQYFDPNYNITDYALTSSLSAYAKLDGTNMPFTGHVSSSGSITAGTKLLSGAGTAGSPAWTFSADQNTGIYNLSADVLGFATAGTLRMRVDASALILSQHMRGVDGSTIFPTYAFANNTNTGMYRPAASTIGFVTAGVSRMQIGATGEVAVGTTPNTAIAFRVISSNTQLTATRTGMYLDGVHTLNANNAIQWRGNYSGPAVNQAGFNQTTTTANGGAVPSFYAFPQATGASGTVTNVTGYFSTPRNTGAGTVTDLMGYSAASGINSGGGVVTNNFGFYTADQAVGTNNYGFYSAVTSGSGKWSFYSAGSADNYLAGKLGIGSGKTAPAYAIDLTGEINATTGFRVNGTAGFTGTGAYTNFTIVGGIITNAS